MSDEVKENALDEQTQKDVEEVLGTSDFAQVLQEQIEAQEVKEEDSSQNKTEEQTQETSTESDEDKEDSKEAPESTDLENSKEETQAELTEEQQAWKKAFDNRESWNKTYKERSMADSFLAKMNDEQLASFLPHIMPFVHGHTEIPKDFDNVVDDVLKGIDIPESLTFKDEEFEEDIQIPKELYMPVIQKAVKNAIQNSVKELPGLRQEYAQMREQVETAKEYVQTVERQNGELIINYFAEKYPGSIPDSVNEEETPAQAVMRVLEAGDEHPEFVKVLRIQQASDFRSKRMQEGKTVSFENAYETLFGIEHRRKQQEAKAKKDAEDRQAKIKAEKTGREVTPDPNDHLYKYVGNSHANEVEAILHKELNG